MGMFDYVRCDYPVAGNTFSNCQTKSMDPCGGSMAHFYIDPAGQVWEIDYSGTQDFCIVPEEQRKYKWQIYTPCKNGKHGRVAPYRVTDYVIIYPSDHEGPWEEWPEARLHIVDGKVKDYSIKLKGDPWFQD